MISTWPRWAGQGIALCLAALIAMPVAAEHLRFLGNRNLPPYAWQDGGRSVGIAIDLARAAAEKASLDATFETMEWSDAQMLVAKGGAAALVHINPTPEREFFYDFSEPLLNSRFSLFRRITQSEIRDINSIAGKRVGVEEGGFPRQYLEQHKGVQLVFIRDWKTGFEMLNAGNLDAIFVDQWVGEYQLQLNRIDGIIPVEPALFSSASRIAVKKGNHALLARINEGLAAIQADGTRASIENSWRGKQIVYVSRETLDRWFVEIGVVLLILLAGLLAMSVAYIIRSRKLVATIDASRLALKDSSERLDRVFRNAAIGMAITSGRTIAWVNPKACEIIGYAPEEMIGKTTRLFYSSDESYEAAGREPMARALATGSLIHEAHLRRKDGSLVWVRANVRIVNRAAVPFEAVVLFEDITEAKGIAEELENYRNHLEQTVAERTADLAAAHRQLSQTQFAMDKVGIGISWVSVDTGQFIFVNRFYAEALGYTADEMLRMQVPDIDPHFPIGEFKGIVERSKHHGHQRFETEHKRKDGRLIPVEINLYYQPEDGKEAARLIAFMTDISVRKQLESQLREAAQRMQQALYVGNSFTFEWTAETDKVVRSDSCANILKLPRDQAVEKKGENYLRRIHADDRAHYADTIKTLNPAAASYRAKYRVTCGDGSIAVLEESGQGRFDDSGRLIRVIGVATDVTSYMRLLDELTAARREAESAAVAKSHFLANMSHEIRTPLNGVLGMAQIGYRDSVGRKKTQDTFSQILDSGNLLLAVINDILDFSKIEAGKLDIESIAFDPARVAGKAVDMVAVLAEKKNLRLRAETSGLPAACLGDPTRITQVLLNLLSNAIKFTEAGEVELRAGSSDGTLFFRVSDTGIGMTHEALNRLFQPFEQAEKGTSRKYGGTGLGLSISHRLASLMGGSLSAESTPGSGSAFTLQVPLLETKESVADHAAIMVAGTQKRLIGLCILVAEDTPVNQLVIKEILTGEGAKAVIVSNGREAVEAVARQVPPFDLILMDVQMPEMDGIAATRLIRLNHPDVPVIGQTAYARKEDRDRCLAAGMVTTVSKPIDIDDLVRAILGTTLHRHSPAAPAVSADTLAPSAELPVIDWSFLFARHRNKKEFIERLLRLAIQEHADDGERLRTLVAQSDMQRIEALAHKLKGTGGVLAASQMAQQAGKTMTSARARDPATNDEALKLATAVDQLMETLRRGFPESQE